MYNHKALYYQKREELGFSSVVEILSCMCEALGSIPSIIKKKERKWRKFQKRGGDRSGGQNNCKAINQRGDEQCLETENVKVIDSYQSTEKETAWNALFLVQRY